jgi:hypothetical protein
VMNIPRARRAVIPILLLLSRIAIGFYAFFVHRILLRGPNLD